jgi:hypothetical protein
MLKAYRSIADHNQIDSKAPLFGAFLLAFKRNITSLLFLCELHSYSLNYKGLISVICFVTTTTKMKSSSKLAILQSLDVMDQMQMENVLVYIRQLLQQENVASKSFKKEAMKEIRKALRQCKQPAKLQLSA